MTGIFTVAPIVGFIHYGRSKARQHANASCKRRAELCKGGTRWPTTGWPCVHIVAPEQYHYRKLNNANIIIIENDSEQARQRMSL